MKTAIMQPYFLPYIGYFQLIAAVDLFIVYDTIKYTKKGWINRNRILRNGEATVISLPLKADSDSLDIVDRRLALDYDPRKLLAQIENAYRHAPYYRTVYPVVEAVLRFADHNLFHFLLHSIEQICAHLGIGTAIRCSSSFTIPAGLRAQDKVLALCAAADTEMYFNPIGGTELYERQAFAARGVELRFLRAKPFTYPQFGHAAVPWLSIVDVMMFISPESLETLLRSGWTAE